MLRYGGNLRSPYRKGPLADAFTPMREVLVDLVEDVRPIMVGLWAVAGRGYITTTPMLELVVDPAEEPHLRAFLERREAPWAPFADGPLLVGTPPHRLQFSLTYAGRSHRELLALASPLPLGDTSIDVLTIDGLRACLPDEPLSLPTYLGRDLDQVDAGTHELDDGERGDAAWRILASLNAGAWHLEDSLAPVDLRASAS